MQLQNELEALLKQNLPAFFCFPSSKRFAFYGKRKNVLSGIRTKITTQLLLTILALKVAGSGAFCVSPQDLWPVQENKSERIFVTPKCFFLSFSFLSSKTRKCNDVAKRNLPFYGLVEKLFLVTWNFVHMYKK